MSAAVLCLRHGLDTLYAKSGQREQARAELSTVRRGIDCQYVMLHLDTRPATGAGTHSASKAHTSSATVLNIIIASQ